MPLRIPRTVLQPAITTLTPFLYPPTALRHFDPLPIGLRKLGPQPLLRRNFSSSVEPTITETAETARTEEQLLEEEILKEEQSLSKAEEDFLAIQKPQHPHSTYTTAPFTDLRILSLAAGSGGHGCVSFLREKFVPEGPANGGDGGRGGSVYIQAVYGETSLHKIGREGLMKATPGKNGRGSTINGKRGEDVIIRVPVGTVVRELSRWDPTAEEEEAITEFPSYMKAADDETNQKMRDHGPNEKWLHYPSSLSDNLSSPNFTEMPYPSNHHRSASQILTHTHPTRVNLDLTKPTPEPILLIPGAPGGLGNPHFVSANHRRPKFATRGGKGARMKIQLELKMLADVGLVGLPNAGKSSFLRAVSGRKARVGEWAFTTLSPNIGTIVMEERSLPPPPSPPPPPQTTAKVWGAPDKNNLPPPRFTIADIPGLIADAHLNKGLGHGFLRHIERARVLGFVIDLSREDPVKDLEGLWREVKAYEEGWTGEGPNEKVSGMMSEMSGNLSSSSSVEPMAATAATTAEQASEEEKEKEKEEMVFFAGTSSAIPIKESSFHPTPKPKPPPKIAERPKMSSKPWFVIANKADLTGTEEKYWKLKKYVDERKKGVGLIPVSALKGEGVEKAVAWMKGMLGF